MNTGFVFSDSESLSNLNGPNAVNWNESPILRSDPEIKSVSSNKNLTLKAFFTNKLANLQQLEIVGTVRRFYPPTGQDIISRNGKSINVKTNYQCITRMKEYEEKSLEELRLEDYLVNRKHKVNIIRPVQEQPSVENKIKQISESIKTNLNKGEKKSKPNALIRKSKNEMVNYFNSLQNEINHRTDMSINRLNNYRHRMIKDLEVQKRLVIEDEDLESDEIDESRVDLNETVVKQLSDNEVNENNNNLTIIHHHESSFMLNNKPFKLVLSPTPTKSSIIDSTTSLTNFTSTSANTATTNLTYYNFYETRYLYWSNRSLFSMTFFIFFFSYMLVWFIWRNRLRVLI